MTSIYGRLSSTTGALTEISYRAATYADDVPLSAMPSGSGPWAYDSVNQVAVASASLLTSQVRAAADAALDALQSQGSTLLRALVLVLVDEINALRDRCTAQDSAVAAATSLANLQSRWATLAAAAPLPDRTGVQARSAIKAKIDAGSADS